MQVPPAATWNSLEIAKLIVAALTPLLVAAIGLWINHRLKGIEYLQWTNQKLTEKRITVFEQLAPLLNDLLCYFTFVGCWKDLTPPDMVGRKRDMDRIVHVNAPLFSREFVNRYNDFINSCYQTYTGWGRDAKLRTPSERRKSAAGGEWKSVWQECFTDEDGVVDPKTIRGAYQRLMTCFSAELGVGLNSDHVPSGRIPANIK